MANYSSATKREHTPRTINSVTNDTSINTTPADGDADDAASRQMLEILVELICGGGDDPRTRSAALLVLMGTIQHTDDPSALAHAAKHLAFIQCGEFNAFGIVDAQISTLKHELLTTRN